MLSLSHATSLLTSAAASGDLAPLARELGFSTPPLLLDDAARERLALPNGVTARVARGAGVLRLLTLHTDSGIDLRDVIAAVARRLTAAAPQLLWLLATRDTSGTLTLAAWSAHPSHRISAFTPARDITRNDAETFCALSATTDVALDVERHLRWLDVLGREGITRRFFRALSTAIAACTTSLAPTVAAADASGIALLTTSRLLFLSFLEAKGWLAGDFGFLANGFASCMGTGGDYHRRVLDPLFFGTLNTRPPRRASRARAFGAIPFLNGGLFTRTPLERLHRRAKISDDALGALFGDVLIRYRFTPAEAAPSWSDAAIDPEILGRTFESLMASADRKRYGVYYTPRHLVERVTNATIAAALDARSSDAVRRALRGDDVPVESRARALDAVHRLRVIDPACGSGAFLVYALEYLTHVRVVLGETSRRSDIARAVVESSLFGVDVNPVAVWLCQLRLWLATVADATQDDPLRVRPLPNLDRQIRIGDSLAGPPRPLEHVTPQGQASAAQLRRRYVAATGARKATLARALDRVERRRALDMVERSLEGVRAQRHEILIAARSTDLFRTRHALARHHRVRLTELRAEHRALRTTRARLARGGALPFAFASHFPEAADAGGFDAVVGNPPWVRTHALNVADRDRYRVTFRVARTGWRDGARASGAPGFAMQTDLAALFVERAVDLVRVGGALGYLLPAKLWRSLAGGGMRALLRERTRVLLLEDHSRAPAAFDAAAYPSIIVARRSGTHPPSSGLVASVSIGSVTERWRASLPSLALDTSSGAPWLLAPPCVRRAFDAVRDAGVPLAASPLGRPWLGVKSGCNHAFLVSPDTSAPIEHALLRPVLRGETVRMWSTPPGTERIIWTHADSGEPLDALPPAARRWLSRFRHRLEHRSDAHGAHRWWSLYRTEAADVSVTRVAWNDIGRRPRATVVAAGDPVVPLNTCYVVRVARHDDALALATLLNSRVAAGWLSVIAEPARGGHHRYLGWTVGALPIPHDWNAARARLAPVAADAIAGMIPTDDAVDDAVCEAYRLTSATVRPLVDACAS